MSREFRHRLSSVDNVLHGFERRGVAFFDDTLRLGRIFDLLNKRRLKEEFTRDVIQDMPQQIEREVHGIIDWMVASDLRQWQGVMARIEARRTAHAEPRRQRGQPLRVRPGAAARDGRPRGRAHHRTSYDQMREAETMAESVQAAVAGAALAEVGAIGLGAAVTALATTTFADVTGILAASALAVVGTLRHPACGVVRPRPRCASAIDAMRRQLMGSLTGQFDREIERSLARVRDAIAPYSRFVRTEHERLAAAKTELTAIRASTGGAPATRGDGRPASVQPALIL